MRLQRTFKAHPNDTILVSYPKCGTTWLKALAFTITNRSQYDFDNHPLLSRHPQELVPFLEIPFDKGLADIETLSSPRLLATHMPLSLLPESIIGLGYRIIYIYRDPKDVFVSWWHFENKVFVGQNKKIDLEVAFNMFCEGFSLFGPFWDHCLEYWRESIAKPDKLLFVKYEDMMLEPTKYAILLAKFLGVPFSDKEHEDGVPEQIVRLCSFDNLSSMQTNHIGELVRRDNLVLKRSAFFRKGKVGDWVNHISQEMGRKLDHIVEEKLKGSGLVL